MAGVNFYQPRPQLFDNNGNPATGGRLSFFDTGTSTPKAIFTDAELTVPATNPHILTAAGYVRDGGIYLAEGDYKVVFERSDQNGGFIEDWTVDPVQGAFGAVAGVNTFAVLDNIAAMKGLDAGAFDSVYLLGYYEKGDSGGGWFYWDGANTDSDDAGSIIEPGISPATGRWVRIFDVAAINAAQWGAMPSAGSPVDARLLAMVDYAQNNPTHRTCIITAGDYSITGSFSLTGDVDLHLEPTTKFVLISGTATLTLSCSTVVFHGEEQLVSDNLTLVWTPADQADANILWWGTGDWPTWERAEFAYNGRLIISTDIAVDGVVTNPVNTGPLHFTSPTASLLFSSVGVFNITNYTFEARAQNLFTGDWAGIVKWIFQREFQAEHFNLGNAVTQTEYTDLIDSITDSGNNAAQLNWGVKTTYDLIFDLPSIDRTVRMNVEEGTLIKFPTPATPGSGTWFGTVISPASRQIFDNSGTSVGVPLLQNNTFYAQWWGLRDGFFTTQSTINVTALNKTFEAAILTTSELRLAPWISLNGAQVFINSTITFDSTIGGKAVRIRDGVLIEDFGFAGTSFLEIANDFEMKNITLNPQTTISALRLFDSASNTMVTGKITDCYIETVSNGIGLNLQLPSTTDVAVANTNFISTGTGGVLIKVTVGTPTQQYVNCSFTGNNDANSIDGTNKAVFSSCTFDEVTTQFDASHVSNCTFQADCDIQFNAGCSVTGGLFQGTTYNVFCIEGTEKGVSIAGATFRDSVLSISDPTDVSITGCSFNRLTAGNNGNILLTAGLAAFVCNGVVIKNNVFRNSASGTPDIVEEAGNIFIQDHVNCDVSDNTFTGFAYTGTKKHFTGSGRFIAGFPKEALEFTYSRAWIILPRFTDKLVSTTGGETLTDAGFGGLISSVGSSLDVSDITVWVHPNTETDNDAVSFGGTFESNNIASEDQ